MYKLYYSRGTCSLAANALLNFLEQKVELVDISKMDNYKDINATGSVPYLVDGNTKVREGAAIALYLMEKHSSPMLPKDPVAQSNVNQWMMFANATIHPAYGKLFFSKGAITDENAKQEAFKAAYAKVNKLWKIVDDQLAKTKFVAGNDITMGDIFMAVYANWNHSFGSNIVLGPNVTRMVKEVASRPAFQKAMESEGVKFTVQ